MKSTTFGTIVHGALGDCYEQLCAVKALKSNGYDGKWFGFFLDERQLQIMNHFDMSMLEGVYGISQINEISIDLFYQFQAKDQELQKIIDVKCSANIKKKINVERNILPWDIIKRWDYSRSGLDLPLSEYGREYLQLCKEGNDIDDSLYKKKFTVCYLWRYRNSADIAIPPYLQRSREWIIKTKSELFEQLIDKYNAHIIIAGMGRAQNRDDMQNLLKIGGCLPGEYKNKYTKDKLDLPPESCTYLRGLGYAAELEIMSCCDLLLMMPSGFSEILWMKRKSPVLLMDSPPVYTAKLLFHRMPFYNNQSFKYLCFNVITKHSSQNVMKFLKKEKLIDNPVKNTSLA